MHPRLRPHARRVRRQRLRLRLERPEERPARRQQEAEKAKQTEARRQAAAKERADRLRKAEEATKQLAHEKAMKDAAFRLSIAKGFIREGKKDRAAEWLRDLIRLYPDSKAAAEARQILDAIK
jgi:TolA-binding protein